MVEHITAWQCIGCGKLDGPQTCIGVCKDVKVTLVYADDYEALRKQLDAARTEIAALAAQMREIVNTTPRNGQWEQNYRALQERARRALKALSMAPDK